ncbi:contact-dependent growth inhibition system immunity protein [Actinomadura algeriensis]|uniref:CdiI immunity protein domain-containing protein n=1 Tax=Actinomadura algeriensis TaxID=1679523 RepID=A0ABR9JPR1_9ACTN|nr:contact-dependent growth inhibition system immunity protein [Actinomadura algeriensis]MBE1532568.1 hypothetical protein [Actinomadura algeriensis]
MDLRPSALQARFGAAARVLDAYAGQAADDEPGRPGAALNGYLRWAAITDPIAASVAAEQLRYLAARLVDEPAAVPPAVAAALPRKPDGGLADGQWLETVAVLLDEAVDHGFPPPGPPATHWEWNRRFPALAQFLGCYFTQDFRDEFSDHDEAIAAWLRTASAVDRARLAGEIDEVLAFELVDNDLDEALVMLGMDVDPPLPPTAWLRGTKQTIRRPSA